MDTYHHDFADMLRCRRVAPGLSQADVARKLHMNRSTYSYYEDGKTMPCIGTIRKLLTLLALPADAFLYPEQYIPEDAPRKLARRKSAEKE